MHMCWRCGCGYGCGIKELKRIGTGIKVLFWSWVGVCVGCGVFYSCGREGWEFVIGDLCVWLGVGEMWLWVWTQGKDWGHVGVERGCGYEWRYMFHECLR